MPRLAPIPRSGDGGAEGDPGVERRDRRIGPQHQFGAGIEQRPQRERAVGAAGPVVLGDVAIVHGMLRLGAHGDPEFGEAREVRGQHELGVLHAGAPRQSGASEQLERVEHEPNRVVADRVNGRSNAGLDGRAQEGQEFLGRDREQPTLGRARVGLDAVSRAGVERSVGEDLEGAHSEQPFAVEHVARTIAGGDRRVEIGRVDTRVDAQATESIGETAPPIVDVPGHLELDDADDTAGRSLARGIREPLDERRLGNILQRCRHGEAVILDEHTGGVTGEAVLRERRRVEPRRVEVAAHEHGGRVADGGVEQLEARCIRPEPVAEPAADEGQAGLGWRGREGGGHDARRLGGRGDAREVDATQREGVLREVNVVIPQPRQQPAAFEVDGLAVALRTGLGDRGDAAALEADIDDSVVEASVPESGHGDLSIVRWRSRYTALRAALDQRVGALRGGRVGARQAPGGSGSLFTRRMSSASCGCA